MCGKNERALGYYVHWKIPPSLIVGMDGSLEASGSWGIPSLLFSPAPSAESGFELDPTPELQLSVDIADAVCIAGSGMKALPVLRNSATSSDSSR